MARFKFTHGVTVLVVVGSGEFPFDMLRYDSACPLAEADSSAMGRDGARVVCLRMFSVSPDAAHAAKRWESFSWRVAWHGGLDEFTGQRSRVVRDAEARFNVPGKEA